MAEATHREAGTPMVAEATEVHTAMEEEGAAVPIHPTGTIIVPVGIAPITAGLTARAGLAPSGWEGRDPRGVA